MREDSSPRVNRRTLLGSMGAAGAITIAGCTDLFSDDGRLNVRLETNSDNVDRANTLDYIAQQLEDTGYFDVEVETYEFDTYTDRVLDTEYADNGYLAMIGLSGTFNPESFCDALHHSDNHGACCNLQGINDPTLDDMMENARFDAEAAEDVEVRAERYDQIWDHLADRRYSSIIRFSANNIALSTDVQLLNQVEDEGIYPFTEGVWSHALHGPTDEQLMWIDEDTDHEEASVDNIEDGGELELGLPTDIDNFDPSYSAEAISTVAQSFIYEGLVTTGADGTVYPWLAEDYELIEQQPDVTPLDYEEYMTEGVETGEEGALIAPDDVDRSQDIILHPNDNPFAEDEVRVLYPRDAAEAVDDGTFGMQFRYHLREGVEFHNGDEMTAEDVVASYQYTEGSSLAPQTFDSVLHVEEVDEYTVDIYAQIVDAEAERELPGVDIYPKSQIEDFIGEDLLPTDGAIDGLSEDEYDFLDDDVEGPNPIGTGPYEFVEYESEESYEVEKFGNYWLEDAGVQEALTEGAWEDIEFDDEYPDGPVVDSVSCSIVPDDSTREGALLDDDIQATYGLPNASLDTIDGEDGYVVYSVVSGGYDYLQYPVQTAPFSDPRLRRAVNHLIDRETINDEFYDGYGEPAFIDIPPLAQGTGTRDAEELEDRIKPTNEYRPDEAEELIEDVIEDLEESADI